MEANKPIEEAAGTYETGVTQPGKSHRGIIAVLLMLVIFLSGVVTALGLMNVRLFRQLNGDSNDKIAPVSFEAPTDGTGVYSHAKMNVGVEVPELDIWYVFVSGICNEYYDIPMGPLVTSVGEKAKAASIREGDILQTIKGSAVQTAQQLQEVLLACQNGEKVSATIYRVSEKKEIEVTLSIVK